MESQSPGLIENLVMSRDVWTADGIDPEGSMCRRDQRTSQMNNDETLGGFSYDPSAMTIRRKGCPLVPSSVQRLRRGPPWEPHQAAHSSDRENTQDYRDHVVHCQVLTLVVSSGPDPWATINL